MPEQKAVSARRKDENEEEKLAKKFVPKNTATSSKWALIRGNRAETFILLRNKFQMNY